MVYLSAMEEGKFIVAQANAELKSDGSFVDEQINCRHGGDYIMAVPEDIHLIDVSPRQLVSVAAALIPFLENDDANRALMGRTCSDRRFRSFARRLRWLEPAWSRG